MVVWEDGKMKKSDYRKFIIRTVEGVEPLQLRAHDFVGDRGAQKPDCRADPGVRRNEHPVEAELVRQARGMQGRRAAERH